MLISSGGQSAHGQPSATKTSRPDVALAFFAFGRNACAGTLIEHFRDPERRKEFFKEYKEIEMLYEIISPDAFLRPFIDDYGTLSAIYQVVRKAYTRTVMVDREFQAKTNHLVQQQVGSYGVGGLGEIVAIDGNTIELIKNKRGGDGTKVINLIKSIEKLAEEGSDDPYLIAMAERARAVQELSLIHI